MSFASAPKNRAWLHRLSHACRHALAKAIFTGLGDSQIPTYEPYIPPRTGTQGSHSQEGTAVVVRDLPEHPQELGDTERNGVRNTRVGKLISRRCLRSSRKGKISIWRHARGTNMRPPSWPARSWSYPSASLPKKQPPKEVLIPQPIFPYLSKSKRSWPESKRSRPSPPSLVSGQHKSLQPWAEEGSQ